MRNRYWAYKNDWNLPRHRKWESFQRQENIYQSPVSLHTPFSCFCPLQFSLLCGVLRMRRQRLPPIKCTLVHPLIIAAKISLLFQLTPLQSRLVFFLTDALVQSHQFSQKACDLQATLFLRPEIQKDPGYSWKE